MKNEWHKVTVITQADVSDIASCLLDELSCNGLIEDVDSNKITITAYFDANLFSASKLKDMIIESFASIEELAQSVIKIETAAEDDWESKWKQWFKPHEIVDGIIVKPSWETYKPAPNEKVITLDPGMAFGTGLHSTTKLCAKEIAKICFKKEIKHLLDVGSGSGILSIIARYLGIKDIDAVEIDEEAIKVAIENFQTNEITDIEIAKDITEISKKYDLIVANILLSNLIVLKDSLSRVCEDGADLILSGIIHEQEIDIRRAFNDSFDIIDSHHLEEWSVMHLKRKMR